MKRIVFFTSVVVVGLLLVAGDSWARGGRGGGGGAARSGGGAARGGGSAARTPSMSRAASRPAATPSRPSAGGSAAKRPAPSRPSTGGSAAKRPAPGRPSTGGGAVTRPGTSRPGSGSGGIQRPATGDKRPSTGGGKQRPATGDKRPGTGGGIQRPGTGDKRPGTGGGIQRPGTGDKRPGTGGGIQRPGMGDKRPGLSDRPGAGRPSEGDLKDFLDLPGRKPESRPGTGDRPNIGGGDRTNIGNRVNVGNRINTGDTNINIGSGNRINRNNVVNRQNNVNSIRNKWSRVNTRPYNRDWYSRHIGTGRAWRWQRTWTRYPLGWGWRTATWAAVGGWFTWQAWSKPYTYNYGTTVIYEGDKVYYEGKEVATTTQYYEQAVQIADGVPPDAEPEQMEWLPLGVFAIAEENATDSGMLLQLAVSKEGVVAGTFWNEGTDVGVPVEGMVNEKTQRVAWRLADGSNPDLVMETGIYNLTEDETTALVHFGEDQTQTWLMVRLETEDQQQ